MRTERESYSLIGPEMLLIGSLPPIDVNGFLD